MIFTPAKLPGVWVISPERREDERGFFARSWCQREFAEHGLDSRLVQCNISFNKKVGTVRGMHFQVPPHEEIKLVRCTMGAIYDAVVDIRKDSPTFKQSFAIELTAENRLALYIPAGFAHGFQTLTENAEVFYQMSEFYHPAAARGIRWDDPKLGIAWRNLPPTMSQQDRTWPTLDEAL